MAAPFTVLFPPSLGRIKATARAQLLEESLQRALGCPISVRVADDYLELERRIAYREVELAWAPPSVCARMEPDVPIILKAVRFGRSMYRAALVGRAGEAHSLEGLHGLRAGWVDPLSSGGHLLAISLLRRFGLEPSEVFSAQRFFGSYQGALLAVLDGHADVSAIYALGDTEEAAREALVDHVGASEDRLAPFAFTDATPSDGLIVTGKTSDPEALLADLAPFFAATNRPSLLLEIFEAEELLRADPRDYAALRRGLPRESVS